MSNDISPAAEPAQQILSWIIAGNSEDDILAAIAAKWPDEKPKPLIVAAVKKLAKAGDVPTDMVRAFAMEATREIYRKCMEVADHQTALRAIKQLVQLAGD